MVAHQLAIAKATFAASLLRPDVTRISRDEVAHFHTLLERTVRAGTSGNIQTCKAWLFEHIIPSAQRTQAFVKYAGIFASSDSQCEIGKVKSSTQRRSLHVIYLLHDVMHHAKHHTSNAQHISNVVQSIQGGVVDLFRTAALDQKKKVCTRLREVLDIWNASKLLSDPCLVQLSQVVVEPTASVVDSKRMASQDAPATQAEAPFIMPASHGDPTLPFHELPAGNFMPHIIPNKAIAMRSEDVRPLQFRAGPAESSLVNVVRSFLDEVATLDNAYEYLDDEGIVPDIDELGQITYQNEDGELIGDTYYGWSRQFCEKMKERVREPEMGTRRTRSRSYSSSSRSRSRSRSPYKRRRYSNSSDVEMRQGFSGNDRNAGPPSKPPSPRPILGNPYSQPRSNGPPNAFPPPAITPTLPIPFGMPGLPIPPPRPANWQGPWPPPPPPPPLGYSSSFRHH